MKLKTPKQNKTKQKQQIEKKNPVYSEFKI